MFSPLVWAVITKFSEVCISQAKVEWRDDLAMDIMATIVANLMSGQRDQNDI